jgi:FMN phosphatase YigB (HAD superfamily)
VLGSNVWRKLLGVDRATVIESIDFDEEAESVVVHVRPRRATKRLCGLCGKRAPGYDQGMGRRNWRAIDVGVLLCHLQADAPRAVPIGCLSNTNSMHWSHQTSQWPMLGLFDFRFLSFELGLVKPDVAIFDAVSDRISVARDHILYFDDVALNADAARSFGFRSEHVRGIDEARAVLQEVGLLTG